MYTRTLTRALSHTQAKARRYQNLAAQGKLVETLLKEPSQGYMGKRLTALFVSLGERAKGDEEMERVEERAASKKRKSREVREEEGGQHGVHDELVDTSFGGADADLPDFDAQVIACVGVCGCVGCDRSGRSVCFAQPQRG